jgi:predicted DNA-binding transcriptional regulator AlpA
MARDPIRLAALPKAADHGGECAVPSAEQAPHRDLSPLTFDTNDLAFVLRTSLATLHRLRAAGKLPRALRLGGQLRWRVEEVKAWCAAGMPDLKTWEAMRPDP